MCNASRYLRQTIMPEIGAEGQALLRQGRVLCIGAGGLGSPALLYLAAAGIGKIGVVDPDHVEISNLQRQILFVTSDQAQAKSAKAGERLHALNPDVKLELYPVALTAANAVRICSGYDVVLDCTDNFTAKFLINDICVKLGLPMVYGSISGFEGQASVFWAKHGACYRCLHPHPPRHAIPNCAEAGVLGVVAGMFGTVQALEAIKLVLGRAHCDKHGLQSLLGRLLMIDMRDYQNRILHVNKSSDCRLCNQDPETIILQEEDRVCTTGATNTAEMTWREAEAEPRLVYIDVREQEEWNAGHIENALHLPLSSLRAGIVPALDMAVTYGVYCQRGMRGKQAVSLLLNHGTYTLHNIVNGLQDCPLSLLT